MLRSIDISDYALIESSSVEFAPGFNVITGESGAGKSIMMSAVDVLFGGRCDRDSIRSGSDAAVISGEFVVPERLRRAVDSLLDSAGVDRREDGTLGIRRRISHSGTRNFVNDIACGTRLLADLRNLLVDFHKVNDQLALTMPERQLDMIDHCGNLLDVRKRCSELCAELTRIRVAREKYRSTLVPEEQQEYLRQLVADFDRVAPDPGEEESLEGRHRLLAGAHDTLEQFSGMQSIVDSSDGSVVDRLGEIHRMLSELCRLDGGAVCGKLLEECDALQEAASEFARNIESTASGIDVDGEALAATEARLSQIRTLKRRYSADEAELAERADKARETLRMQAEAGAKLADFDKEERRISGELRKTAETLSGMRRKFALEFLANVRGNLADIGFPDCRLDAAFEQVADGPSGCDRVEFMFSANPGEPARPLHRIASSGELSRLMLGMKTTVSGADDIPCVVFDEIDMNIGGETANRVGEKLSSLGRSRQIICISHLAQVAARGDAHFLVEKHAESGRTVSRACRLSDTVPEIGRMLGGGEAALKHAAKLVQDVMSARDGGKSR
ncbi:MAG: DNA repair protein RecN [Victivallaceae bacterium]|nr:DNA repair protein RecN [Victivallaceae bacterium]